MTTKYNTLPVKTFGSCEEQTEDQFVENYTYVIKSLSNQTWRIKNDGFREDMDIALEMIYRQLEQVSKDIFQELVLQRNGVDTTNL
jgi:hypothetical protein